MSLLQDILKYLIKNKTKAIVALLTTKVSAILITFVLVVLNRSDTSVLYSSLNEENQVLISSKLNEYGIEHKVENKSVYIKKNLVQQTRVFLAKHGLPSECSIVGYEIYDKEEPLGTTSEQQHVKFIRALEGELTRTIKSFNNVFNAKVHLSLPKRELFSQSSQVPTASVILYTKQNVGLDKETIKGICNFVSSAVPGLSKENVTLIDSNGVPLHCKESDAFGANVIVSKEIDQVVAYENHLKSTLEVLLARVVGYENVTVKVNVDMNFDAVKTSSETYDPDSIAKKEEHVREKLDSSSQDNESQLDASAANNIDEVEQQTSDTATSQENEKKYQYLVSKTIEDKIRQVGSIKKISVAVLLNENIVKRIGQNKSNQQDDSLQNKIVDIVKAAIGYDESREDNVIVESIAFFTSTTPESTEDIPWWKQTVALEYVVQWVKKNPLTTTIISFIILLVLALIMYFMRTIVKRNNNVSITSPVINQEDNTNDNKVNDQNTSRKDVGVGNYDLQNLLSYSRDKVVDQIRGMINSSD